MMDVEFYRGGRSPDGSRLRSSTDRYSGSGSYDYLYEGKNGDSRFYHGHNNRGSSRRSRNSTQKKNDVKKSQDDSASVASMDSVGKKKSFRRLISRFAEKTSMVGVPYINNAKFWWAKVIWSFMLLVALAVMTLHLWYLIDQFFQFPIQTKVSLGFSPLTFPQITICNTNLIHKGRLKKYEGAHELKDLVHALQPENLVPHQYDKDYDPFADYYDDPPPDYGSGPPPDGSGPPPDGSGPPPDGLSPPSGGSSPPPDGTSPPTGGSSISPDGSSPPPDGTSPPTGSSSISPDDSSPPPDGTNPPMRSSSPPPGDSSPPPDGSGPPTDGSGQSNGNNDPDYYNDSPVSTDVTVGSTKPPGEGGSGSPSSGGGGKTPPGGESGTKPPPPGGSGGPPPLNRRRRFVENYDKLNLSNYREKDGANRRNYIPEDDDFFDDFYDAELDSQTEILDIFNELYMDIPKHERAYLGHNITDMLVSCTFNGRVCSASMFKLHQTSSYGNCWSITSEKFKVLSAGPRTGLSLVIYLEEMEYLKGITNGFGARIQVSEQGTHPFPAEEGHFIPAAMETSIGLKLITLERKGLPYGKCNDGVEFEKKHGVKYARRVCQAVCESTAIKNKCNCFDDSNEEMYDQRDPNFRPCRSVTEVECMVKIQSENIEHGTCVCDNPCSEADYRQSVSQRQWPSDDYAMILLEDICINNKNSCVFLRQDMDFDSIRNNFLKLNVYYEDLNYEAIEEDAEIEIQQFLSDVGGAIGLWIGLSMLSLCEVVQLFIELCDYGIHKTIKERRIKRKKRRKERLKRQAEEQTSAGGSWPHTNFEREYDGHNKGHISGPSLNQHDNNINYGFRY